MMIDDAQGCNEAREKLYPSQRRDQGRSRVSCKDERSGQHASPLSLALNIKTSPSSTLRLPISQWPPPSQHTHLPSPSPLPFPLPPAQSNVASPLQLPLPSVRSLPTSFAMTPGYPLPPRSVVARSVVLRVPFLKRKRLARSGPWKRPKCSSRAAIA